MKPFATVLARVGPGVRMNQEVCGQSTGTLESFATLFAFKDLLHAVNGPARGEIIRFRNNFFISTERKTV